MKLFKRWAAGLLPLALGACAVAPPTPVAAPVAPAWQAPLPHQGKLEALQQWWQGQGDAVLADLIAAAQSASPSIAGAQARIAAARAERVAAGAALTPNVDLTASVSRSNQQSALPIGTTMQAALQASWEIDLFGARRMERDATQARLAGAQAQWHDARVSVAAETANLYYELRACAALLDVAKLDATSRADTARLTHLSAKAGLQAPANAALAQASAAEGNSRAIAQRAQCDIGIKAMVALTALGEGELRAKLAPAPAQSAELAGLEWAPGATLGALRIQSLPAASLAQRPDVFAAEREVAAASFEVGAAQASAYPRLSLQGAVGAAKFRSGGADTNLDTWNIGPLSLSLPIIDGGRRDANTAAAAARYEQAASAYRATVRKAVGEVEEALVRLDSSAARALDARTALDGYRLAFSATEERQKNGLAGLLELEEARRLRLAAETNVVSLQRERSAAWIALYRAAGGGWDRATTH